MTRQRDYVQVSEERAESEARRPLTERLTDWAGVQDADPTERDELIEAMVLEQNRTAEVIPSVALLEAMVTN